MRWHRPLTEAAVVAGVFASRASAVKMHLADTADVVLWEIPAPGRDRVPLRDLDLHARCDVCVLPHEILPAKPCEVSFVLVGAAVFELLCTANAPPKMSGVNRNGACR